MSTDRDTARIVRSWLEDGVTALPDRVLDSVLDQLPATPQRRPIWSPRRFAQMNTYAKLAIAAAAVLVVAVVGFSLLPRTGGVGGVPTPSPTATQPATVAPSKAATPPAFPPPGRLAIGRHALTKNGVTFSLNIATSGWESNGDFGIDRSSGITPEGAGFIFWANAPVGVYADPCAQTKGPSLGSNPGALAAAVAVIPGVDLVSGPSDVTVGGHAAKRVVITIREDIGCSPEKFYLWWAPGDGRYATELGSTIRTWIVDVDGKIVWIDAETFKGAGPGPDAEIQAIIDSIQFE